MTSFEDKYKDIVYIVIDVESNGSSVKKNSMFALGGIAIEVTTKKVLGGFAFNIKEIEGTNVEERCWNEFWSKNKKMYDSLHENQVTEEVVSTKINEFINKLKNEGKKIMFSSDCAVYDWKWVDTCLLNHFDSNSLGYTALDIYSYAAGMFKEPRHSVWKKIKELTGKSLHIDNIDHDHNPFNDALNEACLLIDLIRLNENEPIMEVKYEKKEIPKNDYFFE